MKWIKMPNWLRCARCDCTRWLEEEGSDKYEGSVEFANWFHATHCLCGMVLPPEFKDEMHPFYWKPTLLEEKREELEKKRKEEQERRKQEAIKKGVF